MDIMLDLETLGTSAGCVVLSIGAVPFNAETGDVHNTAFYADLDLTSQLDQGLHVKADTLLWWLKQDDNPRLHQANAERQHPGIVLDNFRDWFRAMKGAAVWANGATFDPPLLEAVYKAYGMPAPWKYNAVRDVRTLFALVSAKLGDFGTVNERAHDALADALYQAREVCKCIQAMRKVFVHGKQRIAELAQNDAELERQRQARNGDIGTGENGQAHDGRGGNGYDSPAEAGDSTGDGAGPGYESPFGKTFERQIAAERAPAPEARRAEAQLYGQEGFQRSPD